GQKGVDQNLQQTVEAESINSAKQNATATIDTVATTAKDKINSDQNLSSSDKAIQLNRVAVAVAQAKNNIQGAGSLADVNAVLTQATNAIGACYRAGVANTAITKTKQSMQTAPTVNKSKKPLAKKVSVSTYKGLNSFFKSDEKPIVASSEKSSPTEEVSKDENDALASPQTEETATAEVASSPTASDATVNANNSVLSKDANQDVAQEGVTSRAIDNTLFVPSEADSNSSGREGMEERMLMQNNSINKDIDPDFSNHVNKPQQIIDPSAYKSKVATVSTFEELVAAWADRKTTYIDIVADISNEQKNLSLDKRSGRGDVVINGNGHRIDMGNSWFRFTSTTLPLQFVLTNAVITQRATDTSTPLVDFSAGDNGFWGSVEASPSATASFDNVTFKNGDEGNGGNSPKGAYTLIRGKGISVIMSGANVFECASGAISWYESLNSLEFADGASLTLKKRGTAPSYMKTTTPFSFVAYGVSGIARKFSMGNGSSLTLFEDNDEATNKTAFQGVNSFKIGNDVTWTQHGWGAFIDAAASNNSASNFTIGERFTLNHDILTPNLMPSIRVLQNNGSGGLVIFGKGTALNIRSNSQNSPIFELYSTEKYDTANKLDVYYDLNRPKLIINDPRELNISYCDEDGEPLTPNTQMISTYNNKGVYEGNFIINGIAQPLNLWTGNGVSGKNSPNSVIKEVDTLKIKKDGAIFYDSSGKVTDASAIFPTNIREIRLNNNSASLGSMVVQYVTTGGTLVKSVNVPLTDEKNYVGQRFLLLNKEFMQDELPEGYKIALYNQLQDKPVDPEYLLTDSYGQARYAYVPGKTSTSESTPDRIYTIYVWSGPQDVNYQFVDINHKERGAVQPKYPRPDALP
ncbi:MAG: DUF1542 domain-containing protein, partial [Lactobacillus sp.]|nr:DUF1542 domain-containing protein [Lactobacillus sp.]